VSIALWIAVAALCCGWLLIVAREVRHLTQTAPAQRVPAPADNRTDLEGP
jgi:TRAP-type C4-dicarboxylate transport system permease small subunit